MSPLKFEKPLQINLKLSLYFDLYIKLVHGFALLILLLPFNLDILPRVIFSLVIVLSYSRVVKSSGQLYTGTLRLLSNEHWLWITNDKEQRLFFDSGAVILSRLLVFNFSAETGKKFAWCLFPDNGDEALFRQLRIYLRYSTAEKDSDIV